MPTPETRPVCPVCRRPVTRLQLSAPSGPARGGPVAAVPCGDWLTPRQAARVDADAIAEFAERELGMVVQPWQRQVLEQTYSARRRGGRR